ncbi:hypothetical protein [Caldithrix abyssi]
MNESRKVFEKNYRISENKIEILTVFEGHKLLKSSEVLKKVNKWQTDRSTGICHPGCAVVL